MTFTRGFIVLSVLSLLLAGIAPLSANAAVKQPLKRIFVSEGWLENFQGNSENYGFDASLTGWAYDAGKPVTVRVTLQQVEQPKNLFTASARTGIYRPDVNQYIQDKTHSAVTGNYGFNITFPQIKGPGHFTIKSATFNGRPFKVNGNAGHPAAIGVNYKLAILSPLAGDLLALGSQVNITWDSANPLNDPNETYTIFVVHANGGAYGVAGEVSNTKNFIWTVGQVYGGSDNSLMTLNPGDDYAIQIVRQFGDGENMFAQSGQFSLVDHQVPVDIVPFPVPATSRDTQRLSDIRQLAAAQELYYNDHGAYPAGLNQLVPTYLGSLPIAPVPADGSCTSVQNTYSYALLNSQQYVVSFCLGSAVDSYGPGVHYLSPSGISY